MHFIKEDDLVATMPTFLKIELSRHCTVHCLGCASPKEYRFYPFEKYKSIIDKFSEYAFMVQLYEIGEPLHHPDLLKCISYAHHKRIATVISTTLSLKKTDFYWENLVTSGLDRLIVAIDGVTAGIYNRYRVHGNLDLVMDNLKKILQFKKENTSNLFIEWQMVNFSWNLHEQNLAEKLAIELGCDSFQLIQDTSELRNAEKNKSKGVRKKKLYLAVCFIDSQRI